MHFSFSFILFYFIFSNENHQQNLENLQLGHRLYNIMLYHPLNIFFFYNNNMIITT